MNGGGVGFWPREKPRHAEDEEHEAKAKNGHRAGLVVKHQPIS